MQISINMSKDLVDEVDEKRGVTSRSSYIANCIYAYLHPPPTPDKTEHERLEQDLKHANDIIAEKDKQIKTLDENLGFLRSQYSELQTKLLPPPKKSFWDRLLGR